MADPKPLTRDQLAKFLPSHESVRAFEKLFQMVGETLPEGIETLIRLSQEASIDANTASSAAQVALEKAEAVGQESAINVAAAESKASEALDALNRIANALEMLSLAPVQREDTFLTGDYIDLPYNGPHVTQERRVQWNMDDGTIDVGLFNGVTLQVGQEMHYYAKNTSGVTITNGQSVMATGAVGASGKLTIAKAVGDGSVESKYMLGVATQDITNNQFGYVTSFGLVRNINTTGATYGETWNEGDLLFVSPSVVGGLTNIQPVSGQLKTPVAIVINVGTGNGSIFVRTDAGMKINDLDDVEAASPAEGDTLVWDSIQQRWESGSTPAAKTNQVLTWLSM